MLRIRTKQGSYYDVTADGNIIRLDIPGFKASGQWRLTGIESTLGRREYIPFDEIENWLKTKPTFLFKNGEPRYTIRDFDHGSIRVWGNGIAFIWPYEVTE